MISRVADYCFWFGRYLDRAESTARLLQATRALVFDSEVPVTQCWQPLVIVSGAYPSFREEHGEDASGDGNVVQPYMTWSPDNPVSLACSVRAARDCARQIRDALSTDAWEEINELYLWLESEAAKRLFDDNREAFYRTVRRSTQLVLGLIRSTMLHDEPMHFLWLGVMLERGAQTARILDMHHHTFERESAHEIVKVALWMSLLRACSGSEAFMRKHQGRVSAPAVASFLLYESGFPRSLLYCLRTSRNILRDIWPDEAAAGAEGSVHARIAKLVRSLEARARNGDVRDIHGLLTDVVDETSNICSQVGRDILGSPSHDDPQTPTQTQTQA